MAGVPSYWVNSAACVDVERNKITHKLAHGELVETQPWLPAGPLTIGARPYPACPLAFPLLSFTQASVL